jgi:hypothetical protein
MYLITVSKVCMKHFPILTKYKEYDVIRNRKWCTPLQSCLYLSYVNMLSPTGPKNHIPVLDAFRNTEHST